MRPAQMKYLMSQLEKQRHLKPLEPESLREFRGRNAMDGTWVEPEMPERLGAVSTQTQANLEFQQSIRAALALENSGLKNKPEAQLQALMNPKYDLARIMTKSFLEKYSKSQIAEALLVRASRQNIPDSLLIR